MNHVFTNLNLIQDRKYWLLSLFAGSAAFLSLGHHALNLWERPAVLLLLLTAACVPVLSALFFVPVRRLSIAVLHIPRDRILLFGLTVALIAGFVTWRAYRVPSDYQTLTITPVLAEGQTIGLAELKAGGRIVPLRPAARASGWVNSAGILYADESARPLKISFLCPVNAPVQLLLAADPQSGLVEVRFEGQTARVDLSAAAPGARSVVFTSTYRGLPGWIIRVAVVLADLVFFGALVLAALILQEAGQRTAVSAPDAQVRRRATRIDLALLIGLGVLLHAANALTTALFLAADSPAYLHGAVHLVQYGNFDGVPAVRGPGTTLLFAPLIWIFGRNPWGIKVLMHLIAVACIPLSYLLGWQLSGRRIVAVLGGLLAVILPDLYYYANYVMADLPNLFLVLLFCWSLSAALETGGRRWIFLSLATAALATLMRSENLALIALGGIALLVSALLRHAGEAQKVRPQLMHLGLALVLALLPILWWLNHNQRLHGFWGLSDYFGHAIYDGWMYFGTASGFSIADTDSEAVQAIDRALREYPVETDKSGVPTGAEILPSLIRSGYTTEQAYAILKDATWDSITGSRERILELYMLKLSTGLQPDQFLDYTYPLPGEPPWTDQTKALFFDVERLHSPFLIPLQRRVDAAVNSVYPRLYPVWVTFCLLALVFSLFRRPALIWVTLAAILASRIFIPLTLSMPFWRFTLSAWIPLQIAAISWLYLCADGLRTLAAQEAVTTLEP